MKSLARPSFFRVVDLLLGVTNPGLRRSTWTAEGVAFERHKHSFTGPTHGLTIEIFILTRPGRRGWSLMIVKEYWWVGADIKPLKTLRWARPLSGNRSELMAWLRAQEAALERAKSGECPGGPITDQREFRSTPVGLLDIAWSHQI